MFLRLATLAANMANDGVLNPFIDAVTRQALRKERRGTFLERFVNSRPSSRPIFHERGLYSLQALALLEGNDSSDTPTDAELTEIVIVSNDYFGDWEVESPEIEGIERALANVARDSRYNRGADAMTDFVRNWTIFERVAPSGPVAVSEERAKLEIEAFGMSLAQYLETVAGPIVLASSLGGRRQNGLIKAPLVNPQEWFSGISNNDEVAARVFAAELVIDIDDARAQIERRPNGLPKTPLCIFRRPLVRFSSTRLIAASPWLLREQLRLGIWGRLRSAATRLFGNAGGEIWTSAFGDMFESWARTRAKNALQRVSGLRTLVADQAGTGELEDVVLAARDRVALLSVKARLLPEVPVKGATNRADVVKWYQSVLFAAPHRNRRAGALHLLEANIRRVRAGDGERFQVPRTARIYPILVTFEELGDGPILYKWSQERCAELGILQDPNVAPLCFLSADDYEDLLGYSARGCDVFELLDARGTLDDGLASIELLIHERRRGKKNNDRIPTTVTEYRRLLDRISRASFGTSMRHLQERRGRSAGDGRTPPTARKNRRKSKKKW